MTPRLDLMYRHCADLGLTVEFAELGRRHGECYYGPRLIVLNRRLTVAQRTSVLAHEVGHCLGADSERRADEVGASLAITPDEYADAEQLVGHHAGAIARELDVTHRLVLAWRRWYSKSDDLARAA